MHKITYSSFKILLLVTLYCGVFHNSIPLGVEACLATATIIMGFIMTREVLWHKTRQSTGMHTLFFIIDVVAIIWACFHNHTEIAVAYGVMALIFLIDLRKATDKSKEGLDDMDKRIRGNAEKMAAEKMAR